MPELNDEELEEEEDGLFVKLASSVNDLGRIAGEPNYDRNDLRHDFDKSNEYFVLLHRINPSKMGEVMAAVNP